MATINADTGTTSTGNSPAVDSPKFAAGRIVMDASSLTATEFLLLSLGFTPKYVAFTNVTDRIKIEWYEGMAADTCLKTAAAGTVTLETTNQGITICDSEGNASTTGRYALVSQNATLAVVTASDVHTWMAIA
jgi:hypothetical protein